MVEEEDLNWKESLTKLDDWTKKHRYWFAVLFVLFLSWGGFYLATNWDNAFTNTVTYTTPAGYNCSETYRFTKNITPKCILPVLEVNAPHIEGYEYNLTK